MLNFVSPAVLGIVSVLFGIIGYITFSGYRKAHRRVNSRDRRIFPRRIMVDMGHMIRVTERSRPSLILMFPQEDWPEFVPFLRWFFDIFVCALGKEVWFCELPMCARSGISRVTGSEQPLCVDEHLCISTYTECSDDRWSSDTNTGREIIPGSNLYCSVIRVSDTCFREGLTRQMVLLRFPTGVYYALMVYFI